MDSPANSPFAELLDKLRELAATDSEWRDLLGRVGVELLALASEPRSAPVTERVVRPSSSDLSNDGLGTEPADIIPAVEAVSLLTIGRRVETTRPPVEAAPPLVAATPAVDTTLFDPGMGERRCRLKARACDWAERRQKLLDEGADFHTEVQPYDTELLDEAKALTDCYLWMCSPEAPPAQGDGGYSLLARNFETLADALALTRQAEEKAEEFRGEFERAVDLLAEAQSAVRAAAIAAGRDRDDFDQKGAHLWLRAVTGRRHVFVAKYMRIDDPASPVHWPSLALRIEAASVAAEALREGAAKRRKLLGKVRHKSSLIEKGEQVENSWRVLVDSIEALLTSGLPPSDRQLRDAVAPVIDDAPEWAAASADLQQVAREIDRALSGRPAVRETSAPAYNEAVAELRAKVAGKALVMIGGDRRPDAEARLRDALGLARLDWLTTRSHESVDRFVPYVERPDVAVVVQMVLYSSHSVGDVDAFCRQQGKPFVRLISGYHPNQFATRVLAQCSERLGVAAAADTPAKSGLLRSFPG